MICIKHKLNPAAENHLREVIEPLASYISAANRPRATLRFALAALLNEIEATNRIANAHVNSLLENPLS